jgi:hypothetical protein
VGSSSTSTLGIAEERLREADALAVALRELSRLPIRHLGEGTLHDDLVDRSTPRRAAEPLHAGHEVQIPTDRQLRIEHHVLREIPDLASGHDRALRHVDAADTHASRRWREEADQAPHERALPRAVRPEQRDHIAALHPERDVVHGAQQGRSTS